MTIITPQSPDLILKEQVGTNKIRDLLVPIGLSNWQQAHRCLRRIPDSDEARQALAVSLPYLLTALANAAHPQRVLVNFERFVQNAANRLELLRYLAHNPRTVEILVTLFAGSQFLTEILLRHPEYFEQITARKQLAELKTVSHLSTELEETLQSLTGSSEDNLLSILNALRRFQRREFLRIGTYDLLDLFDLPTVTGQLSYLADSLVQGGLAVAARQTGTEPAGFAVIGMGKLGGLELNYSSDIDLLFVAAGGTSTYLPLGRQLIDILARTTGEGFLYRVDMRLRPWGRSGSLVSSLEGHLGYLAKRAGLWEKQAMLKARVIAGDEAVGREFLEQTRPLLFQGNSDNIRADVRAMKERIEAKLRRQGNSWGEVKLGKGSIRDIEFVTQYLQLVHGQKEHHLQRGNTLEALSCLSAAGHISPEAYRVLADGYIFLRTVEHHLQLMHYHQTHLLPDNAQALTHLARRLRFQGPEAGDHFVARYQEHSAAIRAVYRRYLEAANEPGGQPVSKKQNPGHKPDNPPQHVARHMVRMPPAYGTTFSDPDIEHHTELVSRLDHDNLVEVEAKPIDRPAQNGDDFWQVTIVGYDSVGQLSLICGLLFVYDFNIIDGHVFSYGQDPEPAAVEPRSRRPKGRRRSSVLKTQPQPAQEKIVDVFTVRSTAGQVTRETWEAYANDLTGLTRQLLSGEQLEAQGELAKRVAVALREIAADTSTLYPVNIEIDNDTAEQYTVLKIDTPDTIGFLYEFTNALALTGINIRHMTVETVGNRIHDTLYVVDTRGQKITNPEKQRELRVATVLIKQFTHLLPRSPNPEAALLQFRQFIGQLFTRPDWPDELTSLERPEVLRRLARLLGVSEFLWTDFLRMQYANLFPVISNVDKLTDRKSKKQLKTELNKELEAAAEADHKQAALNEFKDREMFRIDIRQIQGHITKYGHFSAELTDLAEVIVEAAVRLCLAEAEAEFGQPLDEGGRPARLSVCGLGKCGGRELGFASDIELMFIFEGSGKTRGSRAITTAEFYEKVVQAVNRTIQSKREGIFELDLRLRPYGKAGSMAVSLDSFQRYFQPSGDAWPYERQALIKLRPLCGDEPLGRKIVKLRDALIYNDQPFDVAAMRAMRERQVRHLVTAGTTNAKFSPGGLVDIEYLVQGLQIMHGHKNPELRRPNTREAMTLLAEHRILPEKSYWELHEAHIFLRRLINALRMVRGHAKDLTVPPAGSEEFGFLARRLNYGNNSDRLQEDLTRHTTRVQQLNQELLNTV